MKRNILLVLFAAVFAFTMAFNFVGCKKKGPSKLEKQLMKKKDEKKADEKKEGDMKKDEKKEMKK